MMLICFIVCDAVSNKNQALNELKLMEFLDMKKNLKALFAAAAAMTACLTSQAGDQSILSAKDVADKMVVFAAGYCKGQQDRSGLAFKECLQDVTDLAIAKVRAETSSSQVRLEVMHDARWTEVNRNSLVMFDAVVGESGSYGSFCAGSCYPLGTTPITVDRGEVHEDKNTKQCHWVLPKGAQVAQGTCFGQAYRVVGTLGGTTG